MSQVEEVHVPDSRRLARKVLKWLGVTILGVCGIACLLFVAAFVINLRDEELAPQTRALLTPPFNPYRPEDNISFALAGLNAPIGATMIAAGEARLEAHNLAHESGEPQRLVFKGESGFVEPLNSSVWAAVLEHREEIDKLLADNRELYERYLELPDLHGYYETASASFLPAYFSLPSQVRRLFLAVVALRLRSGISSEQQRGFSDLERDVRLWHTVLTGDGALVRSMLSTAFLQQDYLLLADMIADDKFPLPRVAGDGDAVAPVFDMRDWDLGRALAAEFRIMASSLRDDTAADRRNNSAGWVARSNDRFGDHFLKLNATLNLAARETERRMLAAADPAVLFRMRNGRSVLPEGQGMWTLWLSYNPVGKVLVALSQSVFENYPLRAWDAAALQRLVRLSYEIRRQRIEPDAIPAFMRQHPEWSTHPADGRPFLWDPRKGELRIQPVAEQAPGRRFSVAIWRSTAAS